jgi:hypothetical protein
LAGTYSGTYRALEIDRGDTILDTIEEVDWRFTNTTYTMMVVVPSEEASFFCDCEGTYLLMSGIGFFESDSNTTGVTCFSEYNPRGGFGLDQSSLKDTILMAQEKGLDSVRQIKVLKLTPN